MMKTIQRLSEDKLIKEEWDFHVKASLLLTQSIDVVLAAYRKSTRDTKRHRWVSHPDASYMSSKNRRVLASLFSKMPRENVPLPKSVTDEARLQVIALINVVTDESEEK